MSRPISSLTVSLLVGLALLGAVGLLFLPRIAPPSGLWWETAWNTLHFPGFVLITIALERVLAWGVACAHRRRLLAVAVAVLIAVGSELAHDLLGRSSSWGDLLFDAVGIAFGLLLLVAVPRAGTRGRWALAGAGVLLVLVLLTPGWRGMAVAAGHRAAFPDLANFSQRGTLALWRAQGNATLALDPGREVLEVRIGAGNFSGVSLWPAAGDWRGKSALNLVIDNPGEPFWLGIRIDDASPGASRHGDRYNGEREIGPGRVTLRLPLAEIERGPAERALDLGRIRRLALFTGKESSGRRFTVVSAFLD